MRRESQMRRAKRHQRRRGQEGFTLLEVLIAIAILLVGIVSVVSLFPNSLMQARIANERTITAVLANSVLGQIRASSAEALFKSRIPDDLLLPVFSSHGLYYGYTTSVRRLNGAADTFLQRVTFTVSFADGRTESYTTFVAQQ